MKVKKGLGFAALFLLFAAVFLLSFFLGRYDVSAAKTLAILADAALDALSFGQLGIEPFWTATESTAILNIRLPRILGAALVGAALSLAGVSYQGMFRNPMVSPDLLGASTGAGFGAALAILLSFGRFGVTLSAFAFSLLAVAIAYAVGRAPRLDTTLSMVLAGVMVSSLFSSATSFVKLVADTEEQLPAITYWLMGSLSSLRGSDLRFAAAPILLPALVLFFLRWRINLLTLSEAEARSMGVDTKKLRLAVIVCATLMTAAAVSISGMIGWVGLIIPHFCRLIFGFDYRTLIPASALMGASFLMLTDNFARILTASELPLGILTSLVGAPVFLYLIMTGGNEHA